MRRRLAALTVLTAAFSSGAATSQALGPVRTGWWNTATVSGNALPSATAPHDLHVALGPAGTLAFAAVSYVGQAYPSAVLTLHVVPNSEVGTPVVLACPTRDDSWSGGGDQPVEAAPGFDCAGRSVVGVEGVDSTGASTLSFLLDPSQQLAPGVTSLALVPSSGTPFSLDLAAPDPSSLTVDAAPAGSAPPTVAPSTATGGGSIQTPAPAALIPGSAPVAPAIGPAPLAPVVVTTASPARPVVAGPTASGVLPRSGHVSDTRGRRDAAVLLLLVLAGLGYALVESRPVPPRLLGGRARANEGLPPPAGRDRGIGRFARPRAEPARRLQ